jgi:hypothetical protein
MVGLSEYVAEPPNLSLCAYGGDVQKRLPSTLVSREYWVIIEVTSRKTGESPYLIMTIVMSICLFHESEMAVA